MSELSKLIQEIGQEISVSPVHERWQDEYGYGPWLAWVPKLAHGLWMGSDFVVFGTGESPEEALRSLHQQLAGQSHGKEGGA